jgi:hypothetical protein
MIKTRELGVAVEDEVANPRPGDNISGGDREGEDSFFHWSGANANVAKAGIAAASAGGAKVSACVANLANRGISLRRPRLKRPQNRFLPDIGRRQLIKLGRE